MSDPQQNAAAAPAQKAGNGKRRRLMTLIVLVIILAAVAYGLYYFLVARFHESTDDAYVNGNVVQITPQVVGTVISVNADDTQTVKVGDPLVTLDPADSKVALDQAEANLAQTVRQVRTFFVNNNQYEAQIALRRSDLQRAQDDLKRRMMVAQTGAVSQEEISHARDAVRGAQASLDAAQQELASNRSLTANTTIADHPNVLASAAKVRDAYINFARNTLPAPVTGYVAKRSVQVGQRVSPGNPLMAIVPLNAVWVDANFKEVQLKHMRIGQPVELTADLYGSGVVFHGKVVGFSAGTGSAFSLLPAQNATGNWIKVVQRLPVRIELDPKELEQHPLRIGLSMDVDVTIKNDQGGQLGNAQNTVYQTNVFDKYGAEADQEIARIIQQNAGTGTGSQGAAASTSSSKPRGKATQSASATKLM
ncbi:MULTISPECIES: EmrA/EmrK family multidrug efflux transporter periplasmic adaptor subunit [unclassified Caballeronia]|uniref:EmrA/EmrK family multidrug efflux transporter periplasmic adaptor subunit n=1 Tax=unclassified Caballeronia TaxID=2646786 RepID=UPI00285DBEF7|nr:MULTISPECIES: EmrA/EmrK family multidrug efflux transporter periplasmic adaptor subunit [unclassified Caballeronia]MDR5813712.1 EmrA/EmrK family multidrug efflux transporter periplasmic adaptor subunit [Caballeronia sp. LZ033]MDR5820468.1 EmrA/EmrK family multidrug efflux transporter periplasmic adaptor subunit [Caballeronia sp. LZ043]MDR5878284.1 EmrA/EmrK family multidrug efflux transporter periplasmic adaptor subunit [Caballeronia sp. LZ032]